MKVPITWLKEFVDLPSTKELIHSLTMAGLQVEAVEGSGGDAVLTLGITPNRGDCLSILGVAREVAAITRKPLKKKNVAPPKGKEKIQKFLKVVMKEGNAAPRYMARLIRGVKIQPSPVWFQKKLEAVGLRAVNNVVDATNYVLIELGQPLHAFNYNALQGEMIQVKTLGASQKFLTLDGGELPCDAEDLFIWDAQKPVALAGIMGGANSGVTHGTTDLVLEGAFFEPTGIHRTSRRLKLSSPSSIRFERGVDPNGVERALHRVTEIILDIAGGTPTEDWIDCYPKKKSPTKITLPKSEVLRHLGVDLPAGEVLRCFRSLGFGCKRVGKNWKVIIPTSRFDMEQPIDLVEELARLYGFEQIPETLPQLRMRKPTKPLFYEERQKSCRLLQDWGFQETCHLSFVSEVKGAFFLNGAKPVSVANPLSERDVWMRPSLVPALLDGLAFNRNRQRGSSHLFELGKIFRQEKGKVLECWHLAAVATGFDRSREWQSPDKKVDFYSLKGILESFQKGLSLAPFQWDEVSFEFLNSAESAMVSVKGTPVGWVGLLDFKKNKLWDIDQNVYAFEIDWESLFVGQTSVPQFQEIIKFPFVERDMALLVDESLTVGSIEATLRNFAHPWVSKIELFDLFQGKSLPTGKKSLAFNIRYESLKRTLTNEEVNQVHQELTDRLCLKLSISLRT